MSQLMMYHGYEIHSDGRVLTVIGFVEPFFSLQDAKNFIDKLVK